MSSREQFALDISCFIQWCYIRGWTVTFGEAYRTKEQQAIYYANGRSKVKYSQHQKRLAMDLHIWDGNKYIQPFEWRIVGCFWESMDTKNRWGGRYGVPKKNHATALGWDRWHFERRG